MINRIFVSVCCLGISFSAFAGGTKNDTLIPVISLNSQAISSDKIDACDAKNKYPNVLISPAMLAKSLMIAFPYEPDYKICEKMFLKAQRVYYKNDYKKARGLFGKFLKYTGYLEITGHGPVAKTYINSELHILAFRAFVYLLITNPSTSAKWNEGYLNELAYEFNGMSPDPKEFPPSVLSKFGKKRKIFQKARVIFTLPADCKPEIYGKEIKALKKIISKNKKTQVFEFEGLKSKNYYVRKVCREKPGNYFLLPLRKKAYVHLPVFNDFEIIAGVKEFYLKTKKKPDEIINDFLVLSSWGSWEKIVFVEKKKDGLTLYLFNASKKQIVKKSQLSDHSKMPQIYAAIKKML